MKKTNQFGYWTEALVYPLLLIAVLWIVFWADHLFDLVDFYKMGIKPKTMSGLKGIIFMPFIHDKTGYEHIVNNSLPIGVLLGALIYYYREIALKVFVLTWVVTGVGLWVFAANNNLSTSSSDKKFSTTCIRSLDLPKYPDGTSVNLFGSNSSLIVTL